MDLDRKTRTNKNIKKKRKLNLSKYFVKRKKEPNFILSIIITTTKMFVLSFIIIGFAVFGAVLGIAKAYVEETPTLDITRIKEQDLTSFIYDMNGDLITEYKGLEHRVWAHLDEIPQVMQDALIATEDVRFYAHGGVDFKRLLGAFVNNLRSESVQGGSTLTQQLIKNTMLSQEQTYKRKIQEAYLAMQLEKQYTKEDIIEFYLNTMYFGSGNYGVKAAAMNYFGKELSELSLRECAAIIGIVKNPYRYDLRASIYRRNDIKTVYERTNLVLWLMYENGFIGKEEYEEALFDLEGDTEKNADFHVLEESNHQKLYDMPHFIEYVISDVTEALMQLNGWEGEEGKKAAHNLLLTGGLHIYTTVDPKVQYAVEDAVYNYDNYPVTANPSHSVIREKVGEIIIESPQPQAAAVVLDHNTGELRALVGSRTEPQIRMGKNRANLGWLPGSTIKPLSLYAPFIEAGYPGGIILEDIPVNIQVSYKHDPKGWYPKNYNEKTYYGLTTARTAVTHSYNNSSARILDRIGTEYAMTKLKEMGIKEKEYTKVGFAPDLSLGNAAINLIDFTAAFATLANNGVYREPISFTKVMDKDGNVLIDNQKDRSLRVFKDGTAFIITEWLKDAATKGADTAMFSNMSIAGKTGTTNEHTGAFFAGYTPYYTSAVTIASDNHNVKLKTKAGGNVVGRNTAAPLWKDYMEPIHKNLPDKPFYEAKPENVEKVTVCAKSGKLPGDFCDQTVAEYYLAEHVPTEECDIHISEKICSYSGKLPSPYCPEEHLDKRSVIVIPKDSILQELSDKQINQFVPGALRNMPSSKLDYDNPKDKDSFCPLHTKEWKDAENKKAGMRAQADSLIEQIHFYDYMLSQEDKNTLNLYIDKVNKALETGNPKPPKKGEGYMSKIEYFNPDKVTAAMDDLRDKFNDILERLEQ